MPNQEISSHSSSTVNSGSQPWLQAPTATLTAETVLETCRLSSDLSCAVDHHLQQQQDSSAFHQHDDRNNCATDDFAEWDWMSLDPGVQICEGLGPTPERANVAQSMHLV